MADANKTSFLGSISPWSASRSGTPPLPSQSPNLAVEQPKEDALKPNPGLDHSISLRPSPSLRRYPKDAPPLNTRWYYAVDVAKRKPFAQDQSSGDKVKSSPVPKKLVAFSSSDSQAIESAFQSLDRGGAVVDENETTSTRVPVNEDYLFDVHIEKRELEPAYWLGPVYEVRRGSWFFQDGSNLRPCDENLANQLEEGYLKTMPWRNSNLAAPRSASQPRSRPTSIILDAVATVREASPAADKRTPASETPGSSNHRLFGTYMNTTVTYQDSAIAFLSTDDFMSRMSSTVYGRFGGKKVVRGFSEVGKAAESAATANEASRKSSTNPMTASRDESPQKVENAESEPPSRPRPGALERHLSSLAGIPGMGSSEKLDEEEARQQEEQEMEDSREKEGDDQARKIDHLVLVTHGVGQRLGLRLDSINFIHDVNTLRKTMKAVYESAPDLQALGNTPKNCSIQVLPICWRHLLDFPKQSLKQNRQEHDIGDMDDSLDEDYPSLQDITVEGVPAVRNLITDLAMDVLLYQSAYREHIASIVQKECNRVHRLFKARTGFTGKVSLYGHSLGSAILFDILCRQSEANVRVGRRRASTKDSTRGVRDQESLRLDFDCDSFFCLGSPIAMFQMLKGRTISGRNPAAAELAVPMSPFDPDPFNNDPFSQEHTSGKPSASLIPITTSSPKTGELYNIFHPTDPIAYRMEPLISPAMAQLKSQPLPYTKKGLFAAPGLGNISARVTQQLTSSWFNLTSGAASMLINRSLGITGEGQALPMDKSKAAAIAQAPTSGSNTAVANEMPISDGQKQQDLADAAMNSQDPENRPTLIDSEIETLYAGFQKRRRSQQSTNSDEPSGLEYVMEQERGRKFKREEAKVKALNSNGRVDYHIQEGMFDVSLLASIASHLSYWADEDVNHFMIGQMLKRGKDKSIS